MQICFGNKRTPITIGHEYNENKMITILVPKQFHPHLYSINFRWYSCLLLFSYTTDHFQCQALAYLGAMSFFWEFYWPQRTFDDVFMKLIHHSVLLFVTKSKKLLLKNNANKQIKLEDEPKQTYQSWVGRWHWDWNVPCNLR